MRKSLFAVLSLALLLCACNNSPKVKTYQDAEREFLASLTQLDTFTVFAMGQEFMQDLMPGGDLDSALAKLTVVENNVLYRISDQTIAELRNRFSQHPVTDYTRVRYSFSTEANNDLVYRYCTGGELSQNPGIKLAFTPVKVEGRWFLTLKDGRQYSNDFPKEMQAHPLSPAPYKVVLHKKDFE